jgi:hypothetical protein
MALSIGDRLGVSNWKDPDRRLFVSAELDDRTDDMSKQDRQINQHVQAAREHAMIRYFNRKRG